MALAEYVETIFRLVKDRLGNSLPLVLSLFWEMGQFAGMGQFSLFDAVPILAESVEEGLFAFGAEQVILATVGAALFEVVIEYFGQVLLEIDD